MSARIDDKEWARQLAGVQEIRKALADGIPLAAIRARLRKKYTPRVWDLLDELIDLATDEIQLCE